MHSGSHEGGVARDLLAARAIPGLGDIGLARALTVHGSAGAVLRHQSVETCERAYATADAIIADATACGADVLAHTEPRFPARLRELADVPGVVFAKGALAMAEAPAVAIVGTRAATSYGLRVARAIASTCARAGATIVSGLAQGIDGAAHEAALAAGGRTVAVLGTGLNVTFPRRHRALQERIGAEGLLLSELAPGQSGHGGSFPRRNRLIAALADVTIVVEAGVNSGALITANCALELHRPVLCVPNAIDLPSSRGSNALLKAYAEPLLSPEDVLDTLALRAEPTPAPVLDATAASCWDAILRGASDVVTIARVASLSTRVAAGALTALELEGLVHVDATGRIRTTLADRATAATPATDAGGARRDLRAVRA